MKYTTEKYEMNVNVTYMYIDSFYPVAAFLARLF